jgi:hypothetical protein
MTLTPQATPSTQRQDPLETGWKRPGEIRQTCQRKILVKLIEAATPPARSAISPAPQSQAETPKGSGPQPSTQAEDGKRAAAGE